MQLLAFRAQVLPSLHWQWRFACSNAEDSGAAGPVTHKGMWFFSDGRLISIPSVHDSKHQTLLPWSTSRNKLQILAYLLVCVYHHRYLEESHARNHQQ
jgi:hypothetical protein